MSSNESKQNITQATTNSGYVIIEKYEQYNTPKMSTYKETLRRLHDDNKKLKEENAQILRKKKQYSFVITLCIVILICVVGMLFLDDQLSENKNELKITQQDLKEKTKELADTVLPAACRRSVRCRRSGIGDPLPRAGGHAPVSHHLAARMDLAHRTQSLRALHRRQESPTRNHAHR